MGMAWTKLVHPEFVHQTTNALLKLNTQNQVEMDQLYKHRDGRVFHTRDTHKIMYSNDGI